MTEPDKRYVQERVISRKLDKAFSQASFDASMVSKDGPSMAVKGNSDSLLEDSKEISYSVKQEDKIAFPDLHFFLSRAISKAEVTLYILLDEWSSLPMDIQPYLADFFKRGFFPNPQVVVKIASLEYRSCFGIPQNPAGILGFEIGSDISTALDIDDYYVYDRNPKDITNTFADMLYKHVRSELPEDYTDSEDRISSGSKLTAMLFTNRNTFEELVRASEGVVRDLINIFTIAYFDADRRGRSSIDKKAIVQAARQWFEQDKARNLDEELQCVLEKIVGEVIGHRRARSFLLPRRLEKNHVIQKLFDSRVLHLVQRGYADKDNPGLRYNIYTLDYGTYVDLINTSREPQLQLALFEEQSSFREPQLELALFEEQSSDEQVVPFDDKRSIRRIVLTEEILH